MGSGREVEEEVEGVAVVEGEVVGVAEVEEKDLTEAVKRVETPIRCQWGKGKDLEMTVTRTFWIGVLRERWRQLDQGVQE